MLPLQLSLQINLRFFQRRFGLFSFSWEEAFDIIKDCNIFYLRHLSCNMCFQHGVSMASSSPYRIYSSYFEAFCWQKHNLQPFYTYTSLKFCSINSQHFLSLIFSISSHLSRYHWRPLDQLIPWDHLVYLGIPLILLN